MKYTDIAVIGRDLAGSTAAAMLERAGIATIVVDPHKICPPDLASKTSHGCAVFALSKRRPYRFGARKATLSSEAWIARFGHVPTGNRPSNTASSTARR
jgi:glycine/D-amino acid oxidase-like deaminating enzyme